MRYFEENDLLRYWRQHTGHGIGLRNHEAPFLDVGDPTPLEPGMVFTIEPGLYDPEIGGFRHSDTVVVTADGMDKLTDYPSDIESLTLPASRAMNAPASITITPVFVADLSVEGERMPVYVHVIDHPDARVLVDTGMTELHPAMADMDPRLQPLSEQDFDLAGIDIVVNTHLHADHCGGNHLFAGKPIYVQRRELDDARSEDDYTIREWVEAPGVQYVPVDGEHELLPGLRLVPAPGHTPGMQMVVVETGGRPVIVGGDVAVWFGEFDEPPTEGRQRVLALDPELVWLTHEHEPWRPRTV